MSQSIGIRELAERARKEGAIDLAQGVIQAPAPDLLTRVLRELPLEKCGSYTDRRGVPEFRAAVQNYLAGRNWEVDVENILATAGATGAMVSALLVHAPESVAVPEPSYIGHKLFLNALRLPIDFFTVPIDAAPDWDAVGEQLRTHDALILTSPANPTGQYADPETLRRLSEIATETKHLLILDEMYREFIWSEPTPDDAPWNKINLEYTVVVRSFSKTFAIPGWRAGFAITSPERVEKMAAVHDSLYIGGSTLAQYALAEALNKGAEDLQGYVSQLRKILQQNREQLVEAFRGIGMEPLPVPATYYMLIKHNRESDSAAFEELLPKKIVVAPLNIFRAHAKADTGYIRAHFAISPEDCQRVVDQIS
jgi:aspartate/methionine/tyrosine aminotransferase